MAREPVEISSQQDLQNKIGAILAEGTLYNAFSYTGKNLHWSRSGELSGTVWCGLLPERLLSVT